jgi:hypothetical protein
MHKIRKTGGDKPLICEMPGDVLMHLVFYCAAITSEDSHTVAFLQKHKPLWPLMKAV